MDPLLLGRRIERREEAVKDTISVVVKTREKSGSLGDLFDTRVVSRNLLVLRVTTHVLFASTVATKPDDSIGGNERGHDLRRGLADRLTTDDDDDSDSSSFLLNFSLVKTCSFE